MIFVWPHMTYNSSPVSYRNQLQSRDSKHIVKDFWMNQSLKITVPSNSGYDDATERSNLEAMKKQSFSTYTLAPSLAAMDEGMFLISLFNFKQPKNHLTWIDRKTVSKLQKILPYHHVRHHIMAVFISLLSPRLHLDHDLHQAYLTPCQSLLVWRDRRILQIQIQFIRMNLSDFKDKMINSDRLWRKKNMKWRKDVNNNTWSISLWPTQPFDNWY